MNSRKIQWIDWMKVIGMLFIIWGHCFPETATPFAMSFNVPVFFIVSGFLTKEKEDRGVFLGKLWKTLLVPYLLLAYIKAAGSIIKGFSTGTWWMTSGGILLGFHSMGEVPGCSNLWFVYTLILIKLIHNLVGGSKMAMAGLSVAGLVAAVLLQGRVEMPAWAVSDILISLPFFTLGYLLRCHCRTFVDNAALAIRDRKLAAMMALAVLVVSTWMLADANGTIKIFTGVYGSSMLLYLAAAITGSAAVFIGCAMLDNVRWRYLGLLATGNLVTLTFHRELLHEPLKWIYRSSMDAWMKDSCSLLASAVVLLAFIPITMIASRYLPVLIGGRKS